MAASWKRNVLFAIVGCIAVSAGLAIWQWPNIRANLAERQFRDATTDEARLNGARSLLNSGDAGIAAGTQILQDGTPEQCAAIAAASREQPALLPKLLAEPEKLGDAGREALLELVPDSLEHTENTELGRTLVQAGFRSQSADVKIRAIRLAVHPKLQLQGDLVPLLKDTDAGVRRAAMTILGPAGSGEAIVGTEELFPWLHDDDDGVRLVCEAALGTRGLEPEQIEAGRKMTHPDASERLAVLEDLRRFRDPGPWLERLSRDADPAVRAGAARVGFECRLSFAPWLETLANDGDATVRRIVAFHRAVHARSANP